LIGDQMLSLLRQAPYLTPGEGEAATQALTTLVAGALGRRAESEQTVGGAMREAMLTSVKRHIEQHLGSPDLTAEALCRSFGLSRATLYRLFEPLGGLKTYIQQRRLQAAFAMLVSPAHRHRRIIEIAADCNFSSDATFIRAFRRSFGLTPGEVRSAVDAMRWHEAADGNGGEIGAIGMAWIRQLTNLRPEALNQ
jgi:AraC-like DNA-binding protein